MTYLNLSPSQVNGSQTDISEIRLLKVWWRGQLKQWSQKHYMDLTTSNTSFFSSSFHVYELIRIGNEAVSSEKHLQELLKQMLSDFSFTTHD